METKPWNLSMDAKHWVKAFHESLRLHPSMAWDEGTMIGWFANAIMVGFDEGARKAREEIKRVEEEKK